MELRKDLLSANECMRVQSETVFYNKARLIALYDEGFGRCTVQQCRRCSLNDPYLKLLNSEVTGEAKVANCQRADNLCVHTM